MGKQFALGIDLGATKTALAVVDLAGQVHASQVIATCAERGPKAAIARIAQKIDSLSDQVSAEIGGIGIGAAGLTDPQRGLLRYGKNLDWREVELVDCLGSALRLKVPIWLQTDTNAAAVGESYFGAARGYSDFIYTSLGSGLGGAVVADGRLITGTQNMAGFIGLFSLDPEGRPDNSGIRGCTETVISARGLVTLTQEMSATGRWATQLSVAEGITTENILTAARGGDALALAAFAEMGRHLGAVFTYCVAILNPALIVVAGGLGLAAFDLIIPSARKELERRVYSEAFCDLQITPSTLTTSAVGAACLAFNALGLKPG